MFYYFLIPNINENDSVPRSPSPAYERAGGREDDPDSKEDHVTETDGDQHQLNLLSRIGSIVNDE